MHKSFANKMLLTSLALCMALSSIFIVGCSVDQVIEALDTANAVIVAANVILAPANPAMGAVLGTVSGDLSLVAKAYQDYERALPADKANAGDTVRGIVATVQGNLAAILQDVGIKNPALVNDITKGVAIVNTALIALLTRVTTTSTAGALSAHSAMVPAVNLPVVSGARTAKDLKNAWNNQIRANHPEALIK